MVKGDYRPANLADWFHDRITDWSAILPKGHASAHIFRKTTMQYAFRGEHQQVARDLRVSAGVMMTNYVKETDVEMRLQSKQTYQRILASLPPEVALRYGSVEIPKDNLQERIKAAVAAGDWALVATLSEKLPKEPSLVG